MGSKLPGKRTDKKQVLNTAKLLYSRISNTEGNTMIKKFLAHIVISATLLVSGIAIAYTPTQTSVKTQNTAITDTSKQPAVYKNKKQWLARKDRRTWNSQSGKFKKGKKTKKQKRKQKKRNKKPKKGNKGKG